MREMKRISSVGDNCCGRPASGILRPGEGRQRAVLALNTKYDCTNRTPRAEKKKGAQGGSVSRKTTHQIC